MNEITKWKEFFLSDIAEIKSGKRLTKANMQSGNIPFIGSSEMNNGVTGFTRTKNESYDNNVLGVNYNGSVGFSFYHPYYAIFSDDVKRIQWIDYSHNNKYSLLFLSTIISKQKGKFAYGYKFNSQRMKRQKILLPIKDDHSLDWEFMEEYMKKIEQKQLASIVNKLKINGTSNKPIHYKLSNYTWKEFYFTEVFDEIQRGKRLIKSKHKIGNIPYVSSTCINNGIDAYIGNKSDIRIFSNCISLANSGSVGSAFFQKYDFIASDHVTKLKRNGIDEYAYIFMLPIINRLSQKYSFNREINDDRIKREKLLLPIKITGEINFEFMSSYIYNLRCRFLQKAQLFYSKRLHDPHSFVNCSAFIAS